MAFKKDELSVKLISPKLGGERGARNPYGPTSSHDLVEQMEFLYVQVMQVINRSGVNPRGCPIVDITLGNYKSSTKALPIGPNMDWNQVFAFDKTKGDVLSVTLKDSMTNTVIGKRNFKLAADIPSRVLPDARIAPMWYSMQNTETGYHMELLMSVWLGTQTDEVYPEAWFSDASEVSASCVINTRPKLYIAPRLCYVRVTIVSGHDLIPTDRKRTPSVYVTATLGQVALKTGVSSGTNPSWNQDLIFVTSEPLEGTVYIRLIDRVDDQHEECIGILQKKLSEMTAVKVPGSAPALFYDIEPPVKLEPASDSRLFASRMKMKLATDQAYHVADECIQYSSDYRAFAKGLWPTMLGKLEIGILGASGLKGRDEKKQGIDSYVVAKYGNKWARTRTVVDSFSPKWNEQYSWDVYDTCTSITLGIYDNRQIFINNQTNDVPIGKVRILLSKLQWDCVYTCSFPILNLGSSGLKKMGELQLAIRCVSVTQLYPRVSAPFRWMFPKAHYKTPLSVYQIKALRSQAVQMNCLNLARTEPPLRSEVVSDILKPKNQNFSMRRSKANYERLYNISLSLKCSYDWINLKIISSTDLVLKLGVVLPLCVLIIWKPILLWYAFFLLPFYFPLRVYLWEKIKFVNRVYLRNMFGNYTVPTLILFDEKLSKLDSASLDELAEEFDSFPSSETDPDVLRMRYDRLRKVSANVMLLMGDVASQCERLIELLKWHHDPLASLYFSVVFSIFWIIVGYIPLKVLLTIWLLYWLASPWHRYDLPTGISNFFRRISTKEDIML